MSNYKQRDEDTDDDNEFVYDEDFDAESFLNTMLAQKARPKRRRGKRTSRAAGRSALDIIERLNEERWLKAQIGDLEDEVFH
jgi:hypothetical protein